MLKTTMLSLAAAFGLGISAYATAQALPPSEYAPHLTPTPTLTPLTSTSATQPQSANQQVSPQQRQVIQPGDRDCLRDTGSLIPAKDGQCLQGAIGRSYSGQELRNTGQPKVSDALRMLDPAVH